MGKKSAGARAASEYAAPLAACVVVYFVVLSALVSLGTVESLGLAAAFAGCAGLSVCCLTWQGMRGSNAQRDAKVRELFRRTSMTYSRLKSAVRRGGGKRGGGKGGGGAGPHAASSSFSGSSPPASSVSAVSGALPAKVIDAVRRGDGATVERWIRANNVDAQDDGSGSTLLHFAALEDQPRIGRALLKAGANPVLQDSQGNQPLHIAAAQGSAVLVKYLCERGAEPYAQNVERVSPMDLAEEFDNRGCVLIMERAVRASASMGTGGGGGTGDLRGRTPQRDLGV
jgi:hypothetical protein